MNELQNAIKYLEQNKTLSFHHVAVKFNVSVTELQNEWARTKKERV